MPRGGAGHFGAAERFCTSNTILTCFLLLCEASAHHRSHSEALYCFAAVAAHALTVLPTHGCPCSMGHEAVCVVALRLYGVRVVSAVSWHDRLAFKLLDGPL